MKIIYNRSNSTRSLKFETEYNIVDLDGKDIDKLKILLRDVGEVDDLCCGDSNSQSITITV